MKRDNRHRPLSQSGFHRLPKNPKQRVSGEGGTKSARQVLDAFNDKAEDRVLHATKGFRKLSVKRSRAQMLVASIRNGGSANLKSMRRFLQEG